MQERMSILYLLLVVVQLGLFSPQSLRPLRLGSELSRSEKLSQKHLPAAVEAKDCTKPQTKNELPNDRFARKGGRETKTSVLITEGSLTISDISEGRDLSAYERLDLPDAVSADDSSLVSRARIFLWEHWSEKKPAYLTMTRSSVDATSTSHVFVEEDQTGRWRVAWRIVRDHGIVADLPTYYAVQWVKPNGWRQPGTPLISNVKPDPRKHELEFRDKCGDIEQTL